MGVTHPHDLLDVETQTLQVSESAEPPRKEEWDQLEQTMAPQFRFLAGHWIEPWRMHLLHETGWYEPFRYVVVRNEIGQLLAAIPFAVQKKMKMPVLSLAGRYAPCRGFPVARGAQPDVARVVADYMTQQYGRTVLRMAPIPMWDPFSVMLLDHLKEWGWRVRLEHDAFRQVLHLPASFAEFAAERKGSRWSTFSRRERKMNREKKAEIKTYNTEEGADWPAVIRDLAEVERHSWLVVLDGDVRFVGEPRQRFWESVLTPTHGSIAARVWVLFWENEPVAFTFNLDSGPCRYYVAGHYAEHASAYSPGAILMKYTIEDAIERGLSIMDMGGGDPGYKAYWGSQPEEPLVGCLAFPPGIRGFLMHQGISGGSALRNVADAVLGKLKGLRRTEKNS